MLKILIMGKLNWIFMSKIWVNNKWQTANFNLCVNYWIEILTLLLFNIMLSLYVYLLPMSSTPIVFCLLKLFILEDHRVLTFHVVVCKNGKKEYLRNSTLSMQIQIGKHSHGRSIRRWISMFIYLFTQRMWLSSFWKLDVPRLKLEALKTLEKTLQCQQFCQWC